MKISDDCIEEIDLELDNLLIILKNIEDKNDIKNNAMLIVKEIEWYYKKLLSMGYNTFDIERYFIYYKFVNIKKVSTKDDYFVIFLDVIIVFWVRSFLLRKFNTLFDEKEIDRIVSKIQNFNFFKYLKKKIILK